MTESNTPNRAPQRTSPSTPQSGLRWVAAVVGLLAFTLTAQGILLSKALSDPSVFAEPDYYRKAVDWDQRRSQARANDALGWALTLQISEDVTARTREVVVDLHDRAGAPIEGANIALLAFHKANASQRVSGSLHPVGPGSYAASLPLVREGRWELRLDVTRGDERFTLELDRDVRGPRNVARTP